MPVRSTILTTGQAYHVFNRGLDRRPTFTSKQEYRRAIATLSYYQYGNHTRSLSHHLSRSNDEQSEYLSRMTAMDRIVDIVAFCLMPNHFHFLIIQLKDDGISTFLKQFQGSFTKYSNPRHDRTGALFQGQFKAVRIESEEQFWHVSRYIHLNPHTGSVVASAAEVIAYPWSSMPQLASGKAAVLHHEQPRYGQWQSVRSYVRFVLDNASYQKSLGSIKHLLIEQSP